MRIAISGAGVAGPTLAYWLQRSGHEPTLIEKAPHFRTGGYVVDFWGVGYTVAERMGILPELHKAGYSVRELRIVNDRGRKVGGFTVDRMRRILKDRFTSLPRGDLAAAIYGTVAGRVETIFGDSISAIEERAADVLVSFTHGGPRSFDLVIGADGLHSAVRGLAFGSEAQFEQQLGYHVAAFAVAGYRPRDELVYVSYSTPGKQIARFALRGDRTLFLFVFADEHLKGSEPHGRAERQALLRRVFEDDGWECPHMLRALDSVEELYFDRVSQIRMPEWSRGRVALVGDAAVCVSLLAGEGCGLAMAAAYVLAGELHRAGQDYREAFRRYEQRLRPFIEGKQQAARRFGAAFAPKTWFGIWFRNQVSRLLGLPLIADFFLTREIRDNFDLPDYGL